MCLETNVICQHQINKRFDLSSAEERLLLQSDTAAGGRGMTSGKRLLSPLGKAQFDSCNQPSTRPHSVS
jgi:hypothetical protein